MQTTAIKMQNTTTIRFNDDYTRAIIDKAAELLNQTRTGFLLSAAREKAEEVVKDRLTTMQEMRELYLTQPASQEFINKVFINPQQPNEEIKKAMKEYHSSEITNKE